MAMKTTIVPTKDGSLTLLSHEYGQTFHSEHGAKTEAIHVYLEGSAILDVLNQRKRANILEVGFGAGLNFTLTAAMFRPAGGRLHYTALDKSVPGASMLESLNYGEVSGSPDIWNSLVEWRKDFKFDVPSGRHVPLPAADCQLELLIGDATKAPLPENQFDAVYLDAFDPRRNPALWQESFLKRLFDALRAGGKLATYSVAGVVRRGLQNAGFVVQRRPGPRGKRHCLAACKPLTPLD